MPPCGFWPATRCRASRLLAGDFLPCQTPHPKPRRVRAWASYPVVSDGVPWSGGAEPCTQGKPVSSPASILPERPWLWEHSEWFQPYAAGFYAHYYGDADVTRTEAEERLDELLLLGQPWRQDANTR